LAQAVLSQAILASATLGTYFPGAPIVLSPMPFCVDSDSSSSSGDEVEDDDADRLSYVGEAAYDELRKHHNEYWHEAWNVTSGKIIGEVHQTPGNLMSGRIVGTWGNPGDPPDGHADWFPKKMGEIMSKTRSWCDVSSLGPPDGLFMEEMRKAITAINEKACERDGDIVKIRMLFGNIIGMPVNCTAVIKELTSDIDEDECKISCGSEPGERGALGTTQRLSQWTASICIREGTTCGTRTISRITQSTTSRCRLKGGVPTTGTSS